MVQPKYCLECNKLIEPTKKISVTFIIFSAILCVIGIGFLMLLIYLILYFTKEPDTCPICKGKRLRWDRPLQQTNTHRFCSSCGGITESDERYCRSCGVEITLKNVSTRIY